MLALQSYMPMLPIPPAPFSLGASAIMDSVVSINPANIVYYSGRRMIWSFHSEGGLHSAMTTISSMARPIAKTGGSETGPA